MMTYDSIGVKFRELRRALRWNQNRMADALGVTTSYVGQIERGEKLNPDPALVESLKTIVLFHVVLGQYLRSCGRNRLTREEKDALYSRERELNCHWLAAFAFVVGLETVERLLADANLPLGVVKCRGEMFGADDTHRCVMLLHDNAIVYGTELAPLNEAPADDEVQ